MTVRVVRFAAVLLAMALSLHAQMAPDMRLKAVRLVAELENVQAEQSRPNARRGRTLALTEADLNLFLAYRIEITNERYVKSCEVKIVGTDRIEGKLLINMGSNSIPLLPSEFSLFFSAGVETRDGRARIAMDNLFVGTQRLSPSVIDAVIAMVSRLDGVQPTSLQDWYDLPYGIRKIDAKPGALTLRY